MSNQRSKDTERYWSSSDSDSDEQNMHSRRALNKSKNSKQLQKNISDQTGSLSYNRRQDPPKKSAAPREGSAFNMSRQINSGANDISASSE